MAAVSDFDARAFVKRLPDRPGVYRMLDAEGKVVYVGKARSLRSRVGSYFRADQLQPKVQALVRAIAGIEVTVTNSDTEALLLEHNLIKSHRPRFNVILRDDKSFPYVHLSAHEFPRLVVLPRLAQAARAPVRAVSVRERGARGAQPAAQAVPTAQLQGQLLRQPLAPLPRVPDRPLLRALHRPHRRGAYARDVESAVDGARRAGERRDRAARRGHGTGCGAARLRARGHAARPARGADRHPVAPGRDPGARGRRHRRDRGRGGGRRVLRRADVRARRPGARHVDLSPARADQRGAGGARGLRRAALPRARPAAPDLPVACDRGRGDARGIASRARRPQGRASGAARRGYPQRWVELARQNAANALRMREASQAGLAEQFAELGQFLGLAAPIRAHRVLRREPHAGRGDQRLLRRVRPGRPAQGGIPALQHRGRGARRRLRRPAAGARAALPPSQAGRRRRCRTCC